MVNDEFRINQWLLLKLENGETNIYINGHQFHQCKHLFIIFPQDSSNINLNSIDEFHQINQNDSLDVKEFGISSRQLFWGHCSNLQVWVENDYDSHLLHRSLSFPLLKALSNFDKYALLRLKEEIIQRIFEGNEKVIRFFIIENYLSLFKKEELNQLLKCISYSILNKLTYRELKYLKRRGCLEIENFFQNIDFLIMKKIKDGKNHSSAEIQRDIRGKESINNWHIIERLNHLAKKKKVIRITNIAGNIFYRSSCFINTF